MKISKILTAVLTTAVVAGSVAMPSFAADDNFDVCPLKFPDGVMSILTDNRSSKESDFNYLRLQAYVKSGAYNKLQARTLTSKFYFVIRDSKKNVVSKVESTITNECANGNVTMYKRLRLDKSGLKKGEKYTASVYVETKDVDIFNGFFLNEVTSFRY